MSAEVVVISWRDIPGQVIAQSGRKKARAQLGPRFQEAIDAAAMKAGLFGTDEYLEQWRRETRTCSADLQAEADAEAERIEAAWSDDDLTRMIKSDGMIAGASGDA